MSKKERENELIEKSVERFRKLSDKSLLYLYNDFKSPDCRIEIKKAYNVVLRERGLKHD